MMRRTKCFDDWLQDGGGHGFGRSAPATLAYHCTDGAKIQMDLVLSERVEGVRALILWKKATRRALLELQVL